MFIVYQMVQTIKKSGSSRKTIRTTETIETKKHELLFLEHSQTRKLVIMIQPEILCQSPIFRGISPEDLQKLFSQIHYQVKTYQKNDLIVIGGEICDRLLIIQFGNVKAEMND